MQIGDVVIDVHGMRREREEQRAEEIRIRDSESAVVDEGDSRNRDLRVSSFNSKLCSVIVDPDVDVDNCSGVRFLKNLLVARQCV